MSGRISEAGVQRVEDTHRQILSGGQCFGGRENAVDVGSAYVNFD
jgi:hypothetical protein